MVSGDVQKKIHVELKFLRLEFHHFISFLLPCVCRVLCSSSSLVFFFVSPPNVLLHPNRLASLVFFFIASPSVLLQPDRLPSVSSFFLQIFCGFFSSSQIFFFFLGSFFFFWVCMFYVLCLKSSVKNLRFIFFWTQLLKTRDLCGIIMSNSANSASGKRVFEARDWYGT